MSPRAVRTMRRLLADLSEYGAQTLTRPAEPRVLMRVLCDAMGRRQGREVELRFRAFPDGTGVSGLRLDCGDRTVILIEERTAPEHQLVILGHELWHEERGDGSAHLGGAGTGTVAARMLAEEGDGGALAAVAARAHAHEEQEAEAETFGLRFGGTFRSWMHGPHARGPVQRDTVEGRIATSLFYRGPLD